MKRQLEMWSLVIAGKWNTAILSPQWISKKVLGEQQVGILFPIVGDAPPLYEAAGMRIAVTRDRLQFWPLQDDNQVLGRIEGAAVFILKTLEYTPISAFGENFHFTMAPDVQPPLVEALFQFDDSETLTRTVGRAKEVSVLRSLDLDKRVLNFKVTQGHDCRLDLNYHYEVSTAEKAAELMADTFVQNREHGLRFLKEVYGLELEEDHKEAGDDKE